LNGEGNWREVLILAAFGGMWGLVYGAIMNIWFWPYASGPVEQYWQPGVALAETLKRYAFFYVATSLAWDAMRSTGNVIFILAAGLPTLRALRRFRKRFAFDYRPAYETAPTTAGRGV
jgi:energy-coupling factor transport system substrate-specific component